MFENCSKHNAKETTKPVLFNYYYYDLNSLKKLILYRNYYI